MDSPFEAGQASTGSKTLTIHFLSANGVVPVGTYFRIHNFARALNCLGHKTKVFGLDPDPTSRKREEQRDGVAYFITPSLKGQRFFGHPNHPIQAIMQCLRDFGKCDVLHMFQPFLGTYLPWRLRKNTFAGSFWYDWDDLWTDGGLYGNPPSTGFQEKWSYYWTNRIEQSAPSVADGVTTISEWLSREAINRGAKKTAVVYPCVWDEVRPDKRDARERLGLKQGAIYLGFMGQTITDSEMNWCIEGLDQVTREHDRVRLALCGNLQTLLSRLPSHLRPRVDYLGQRPVEEARHFTNAIDMALLPLDDRPANERRFPQKFGDYLVGGAYTLVSDVGECSLIADRIPSALKAGRGKDEWISSMKRAVTALAAHKLPPVDLQAVQSLLSWRSSGEKLANAYLL